MIRYPIQVFTLISYILIAFGTFYLISRHRLRPAYAVAPLVCVFHGIVFYSVIFAVNPVPGTIFFTTWSSIFRLHIALTGLGIVLLEIHYRGRS